MMCCISDKDFKDINGIWQGRLVFPGGVKPRIVFNISRTRGGKITAFLLRPDQDDKKITVKKIVLKDHHLRIDVGAIPVTFEGNVAKDRMVIEGHWIQGDKSQQITLHRVAEIIKPHRPQEPKKPYPYDEEDVYFENKNASFKLAGTLTLPREGKSFPAIILISGGGAQNRDGLMMGHRPFLVLADYMTRRGFAVLRFDDRGVGESNGDRIQATSEDFAKDVLAGVEYLRKREKIDPRKIGLIGHSEGGIIAPLAAANSPDVAFIVLMAGPGLPGDEYNYQFAASAGRIMGQSEEAILAGLAIQKRIFSVLKEEDDFFTAQKELQEILRALNPPMPQALIESSLKRYLSPWFRFSITHDPGATLQKVECPVLALFGEKDVQVPPEGNIQAVINALQKGGNRDFQVEVMPDLNHFFQTAETGAPDEYAEIEETISLKVLELLAQWILQRTNGDGNEKK